MTIRFTQEDHEILDRLAFALDVTTSKATAILLDVSVRNSQFINKYLNTFVKEQLDDRRMRELKKIMTFVNDNNPYGEYISWGDFIMYLFDEFKSGKETFTKHLTNWIDKNKPEK
ncbi:hypothetical protein [Alteribacter aurantiacus]|uniref:hypothetical protein n=1 Tax=Alteribacter aurantiacus TaxID=254410 RepID=UPI00040AE49C|nr:hypothetical protein [Alteribacter aurantiacus]